METPKTTSKSDSAKVDFLPVADRRMISVSVIAGTQNLGDDAFRTSQYIPDGYQNYDSLNETVLAGMRASFFTPYGLKFYGGFQGMAGPNYRALPRDENGHEIVATIDEDGHLEPVNLEPVAYNSIAFELGGDLALLQLCQPWNDLPLTLSGGVVYNNRAFSYNGNGAVIFADQEWRGDIGVTASASFGLASLDSDGMVFLDLQWQRSLEYTDSDRFLVGLGFALFP